MSPNERLHKFKLAMAAAERALDRAVVLDSELAVRYANDLPAYAEEEAKLETASRLAGAPDHPALSGD